MGKVKALSIGGVDYVTKSFQAEEIVARVETHLTLRSLQKQFELADVKLAKQVQELERTNLELEYRNLRLQEALGTIKTLSGIGPVCAWCHEKIKDEAEAWVRLESYIEDHPDAQITHGIWPDCQRQYDGELTAKIVTANSF